MGTLSFVDSVEDASAEIVGETDLVLNLTLPLANSASLNLEPRTSDYELKYIKDKFNTHFRISEIEFSLQTLGASTAFNILDVAPESMIDTTELVAMASVLIKNDGTDKEILTKQIERYYEREIFSEEQYTELVELLTSTVEE